MALTVGEIMNPELFAVREGDRADDALATLIALGLSAAPVVDDQQRPIGMVSWRDLVRHDGGAAVAGRTSRPATTVREADLIETAARQMAHDGLHHAPVIGTRGELVGFVSLLDILRGVLGLPAGHPIGFPHYDADTRAVWTDPRPLADEEIEAAPPGAGVLVLIQGGRGVPEQVVWAEATNSLRARLLDLLSEPQPPRLARLLDGGALRFRAAAVPDARRRESLAALLMNGARRHEWRERMSG